MVVHKKKSLEKKLAIDYDSLGFATWDNFLKSTPGVKLHEKYWVHSANLPPMALKEFAKHQKKKADLTRGLKRPREAEKRQKEKEKEKRNTTRNGDSRDGSKSPSNLAVCQWPCQEVTDAIINVVPGGCK